MESKDEWVKSHVSSVKRILLIFLSWIITPPSTRKTRDPNTRRKNMYETLRSSSFSLSLDSNLLFLASALSLLFSSFHFHFYIHFLCKNILDVWRNEIFFSILFTCRCFSHKWFLRHTLQSTSFTFSLFIDSLFIFFFISSFSCLLFYWRRKSKEEEIVEKVFKSKLLSWVGCQKKKRTKSWLTLLILCLALSSSCPVSLFSSWMSTDRRDKHVLPSVQQAICVVCLFSPVSS